MDRSAQLSVLLAMLLLAGFVVLAESFGLEIVLDTSMGLPIVVAIAHIGVQTGRMVPDTAAALVGAGMLSVLVFPTLALRLRGGTSPPAGGQRG